MNQDNLFSVDRDFACKSFLISLDYCDNYHKISDGDNFTQDQLMNNNSFFDLKDNFERINGILNSVYHTENVTIKFGFGNILNLIEKPWEDLQWFIEEITRSNIFNHINIEISTSLIGNFNYQTDKAKLLVDLVKEQDDIDIKFIVTSNASVVNIPYWNKVSSFFKIIEEYRNTDNYNNDIEHNENFHGDVLVLNISPSNIPDIHFLYRQISGIKSPINLSWWGYNNENEVFSEYDILQFEYFLNDFVSYVDFNKLNTSLHDIISMCKNSEYTLLSDDEILHKIYADAITHIDMHNNKKKLLYSPLGSVDHEKISLNDSKNKSIDNKHYIKTMYNDMSKRQSCISCHCFKQCLFSGMMNIGYINSKKIKISSSACPLGAKLSFNNMLSNN